jgi:tetratricopeptide (TPR) repeat protein
MTSVLRERRDTLDKITRSVKIGLLTGLVVLAGCTTGPERPDQATARLLVHSQQAMHQGRVRTALFLADSAARRAPQVADVHFQRGRVLSELKRFDQARVAYKKAVGFDPDHAQAWLNLGNNASRQQQYRQAISFYQKAQGGYPVRARISRGRAYNSLGEWDSAEQAFQQALEADSTSASAHAWLSLLLEDRSELDSALHHSRRALRLEPHNVDYKYFLGAQLMSAGKSEEAVRYLEEVVEERPWHHGAHYKLGRGLAQAGRSYEAQRYLARADTLQQLQSDIVRQRELIHMTPDNPKHWLKLGNMLQRAGRQQEAESAFRVARSFGR